MNEYFGNIVNFGLLAACLLAAVTLIRAALTKKNKLFTKLDQSPVNTLELERSVKSYGQNANTVVHMYGGLNYYKLPNSSQDQAPALVGYISQGNNNVSITDPLCSDKETKNAISQFARFCINEHKNCLLFAINAKTARQAAELGFGILQIGKEPIFDLNTYDPNNHHAKILSAVRQAEKKGITVQEVTWQTIVSDHKLMNEMNLILHEWFGSRRGEKLQLISEVSPLKFFKEKKYFICYRDGKMEAFLSCSPIFAKNGFFLHDLIRRQTAINGVSEALTIKALTILKAQGYKMASLGIASLAGLDAPGVNFKYPILNRILVFVFNKYNSFVKFKDLYHFKSKFGATLEEPSYLAFYPSTFKPTYIMTIATMFSPKGLMGDLLHKWRRWSEGDQIPRVLQNFIRKDIVFLGRPTHFTLSKFLHRFSFTLLMVFLNTYTYLNTANLTGDVDKKIIGSYGFSFDNFLNHTWLTLVTSNFLHFNFSHLLGNMALLVLCGGLLEFLVGRKITMISFLIGMNSNMLVGITLMPILKILNVHMWQQTMAYLDVGASLGVMSVLGSLIYLLKHRNRILAVAIVATAILAIVQNTFIGIDHSFALTLGFMISKLYFTPKQQNKRFKKLYYTDPNEVQSSTIPFRRRRRVS